LFAVIFFALLLLLLSVYHVGSDLGWSEMFWFRTFPAENSGNSGWVPTFAIFGDMGNDNAQSLTRFNYLF
jgi:hypothetical protein